MFPDIYLRLPWIESLQELFGKLVVLHFPVHHVSISSHPGDSIMHSSLPLPSPIVFYRAEGTKRIRCICIISSRANYLKEVYRHRPRKPLIAISNHSKSVHYFQLFQVVPVLGKFQVTDDASAIARAALKQLHLFGQHDSALLIVNHTGPDTTKDHHFSRIEEIPLPSSADSLD